MVGLPKAILGRDRRRKELHIPPLVLVLPQGMLLLPLTHLKLDPKKRGPNKGETEGHVFGGSGKSRLRSKAGRSTGGAKQEVGPARQSSSL